MKFEELIGAALPMAEGDYRAAAAVLGVGVPKIKAVQEVESRGRAYHPDTRRPIILYEPHVFHRLTKGRFSDSHAELSYPTWGTEPYPSSQTTRYAQLKAAMALDETAALKSCSWGLFQIMGFNCRLAGFDTVQGFVAAVCRSEGEQLLAFARFVSADTDLKQALRLGDWAGFARRYNGPGYAQHGYDQKLKVAFARQRALAA